MQTTTRVKPFVCTMPMRLDEGWNQIQFNLSDFTRRAYGAWWWAASLCNRASGRVASLPAPVCMQSMYAHAATPLSRHSPSCDSPTRADPLYFPRDAGTNYIETLRVQVHANCRIRRIYFSDRLYSEEELPPEFKLFLPIQKQ
jgi:hypothetical protein